MRGRGKLQKGYLFINPFQLRRFERKRKAPTPRGKPFKFSKKDVSVAAESLLQLSNPVFDDKSSCSALTDPEVNSFILSKVILRRNKARYGQTAMRL